MSKKVETNKNLFAVIDTGGKQYEVSVGTSIKIEKLIGEYKVGDQVNFDKVLLKYENESMVGTPYLEGAKVVTEIEKIDRHDKVMVVRYKQKSRYLKRNGHRQPYFQVKVLEIN